MRKSGKPVYFKEATLFLKTVCSLARFLRAAEPPSFPHRKADPRRKAGPCRIAGARPHLKKQASPFRKTEKTGAQNTNKKRTRFSEFEALQKNWSRFLSAVKNFLELRGAAPVETPSLVKSPGTEPHLIPFETQQIFPDGKKRMTCFLPTSPETALKKLLCLGWTDIFEIKKCFRNGELSLSHQPEFYMLEWYRAFFSLNDLMEETAALLKCLSRQKFFKGAFRPPRATTVADLFEERLNFRLKPETSEKELAQIAFQHQIPFSSSAETSLAEAARSADAGAQTGRGGDPAGSGAKHGRRGPGAKTRGERKAGPSYEELFHLLWLNKIEPFFESEQPLFVKNWPLRLRGFAKKNSEGWADRFELYWRGFELANAFYEVTDADEQEQIEKAHLRQRQDAVPFDKELVRLMREEGMPPASGIAVGLNRLFAALCRKKQISLFGPLQRDSF